MIFGSLLGHETVKESLGRAIACDRISNAYVFEGSQGVGKKLCAKLFSQALVCENNNACGSCPLCVQAHAGTLPDIITLTKDRDRASVGVDNVREQIISEVFLKPRNARRKIFIIEYGDELSAEAQNALLKTIEEPPAYAIIFLLTENADTLLPTIRSRCVMLKLRNIKDKLVKKYLMEELRIPDYQAEICAAFAQGNIGRAIMLAKSEHFNEIKEEAIQLMKYIDEMELHEIVSAIKEINKYKLEVTDYFDIIMIWYRDVLLYKATKDVGGLVFSEHLKFIKERAAKSSYEGIETILDSLEKAKARLKANVNFDLVMELLLLTIKEN